MAFDPKREDYQRLALRFAHELDAGDPMIAARSFASFGRRFAQDRDSLPQSDSDRAFHLVTLATDLIDYQLPFASDEQATSIVSRCPSWKWSMVCGERSRSPKALSSVIQPPSPTMSARFDSWVSIEQST